MGVMKSAAHARRPDHLRRAGVLEMCGAALHRGRVKGRSQSRSWQPRVPLLGGPRSREHSCDQPQLMRLR